MPVELPEDRGRLADDSTTGAGRTVAEAMLGCWRRDWIRYDDERIDDTSVVIWLQTHSAMADLRLDAAADALGRSGAVRSIAECSLDELLVLAGSESSTGHTVAHPLDGSGEVTATWHTGQSGIEYQPTSAYPEAGLLTWDGTGEVMTERAPSGAYVEQWRLLPGSRTPLRSVVTVRDGRRHGIYRAGDHLIVVRERGIDVSPWASIQELVASAPRSLAEAAVDCELSYATCTDGDVFTIVHSTLPWRVGEIVETAELKDES